MLGCVTLFIAEIYPASPYYDPSFFPQDLLKGSFRTGDLRPLVDHYWTTTKQIPVNSFTQGSNATEISRVKRFILGAEFLLAEFWLLSWLSKLCQQLVSADILPRIGR